MCIYPVPLWNLRWLYRFIPTFKILYLFSIVFLLESRLVYHWSDKDGLNDFSSGINKPTSTHTHTTNDNHFATHKNPRQFGSVSWRHSYIPKTHINLSTYRYAGKVGACSSVIIHPSWIIFAYHPHVQTAPGIHQTLKGDQDCAKHAQDRLRVIHLIEQMNL